MNTKERTYIVLMVLITVAITGVLSEIIYRYVEKLREERHLKINRQGHYRAYYTDYYIRNSYAGWRNKPNGKGIYEVGTCAGNIEFDLNGRRTGTNPPDLLAGTPTILFIGDSMVAGFEVDGDKTMAAYARKEFLKKGISVRVINGGVRGYNVL